jgi:hypothetical protein
MKNKDLYTLSQGLESVGNLVGVTFGYAVNKNKRIIKGEIEVLEESIKTSEGFSEFRKKQEEIVKKYAKKDEKGEFIIKNFNYDIIGNEQEIETAIAPLKEEYKEVIEARETQIKGYNELLEKESGIKLYMVKKEDLPKDITAKQLEGIFDIVEE